MHQKERLAEGGEREGEKEREGREGEKEREGDRQTERWV